MLLPRDVQLFWPLSPLNNPKSKQFALTSNSLMCGWTAVKLAVALNLSYFRAPGGGQKKRRCRFLWPHQEYTSEVATNCRNFRFLGHQQSDMPVAAFWINTPKWEQIVPISNFYDESAKTSQGESFWVSSAKTFDRERGFETHAYSRQPIANLVSRFENPSPCGGILIATLVCMYACVKSLTCRGVLKKPDRQRGLTGREVLKKFDRQRSFDKAWQAEVFWKSLTGNRFLQTPHRQRDFENDSQAEGLWKQPDRQRGFDKTSHAEEFWISGSSTVPPLTNVQKTELNNKY